MTVLLKPTLGELAHLALLRTGHTDSPVQFVTTAVTYPVARLDDGLRASVARVPVGGKLRVTLSAITYSRTGQPQERIFDHLSLRSSIAANWIGQINQRNVSRDIVETSCMIGIDLVGDTDPGTKSATIELLMRGDAVAKRDLTWQVVGDIQTIPSRIIFTMSGPESQKSTEILVQATSGEPLVVEKVSVDIPYLTAELRTLDGKSRHRISLRRKIEKPQVPPQSIGHLDIYISEPHCSKVSVPIYITHDYGLGADLNR